jgi:hypothetical protein
MFVSPTPEASYDWLLALHVVCVFFGFGEVLFVLAALAASLSKVDG